MCCILCICEVSYKHMIICDLCKKEKTYVNSVTYYLHIICSFLCRSHIIIFLDETSQTHMIEHNVCPEFQFTFFFGNLEVSKEKWGAPATSCGLEFPMLVTFPQLYNDNNRCKKVHLSNWNVSGDYVVPRSSINT